MVINKIWVNIMFEKIMEVKAKFLATVYFFRLCPLSSVLARETLFTQWLFRFLYFGITIE